MIYSISEIVATLFDVIFLIWFIPSFNHSKFYRKKITLILPLTLLVFQLLVEVYFTSFDLVYLLLFTVGSCVYAFWFSNKNYLRALLSLCLFIVVIMLSGSLIYMIFSLYITDLSAINHYAGTDARILFLLISRVVQFAIYKFLLQIFHADETLDLKNSIIVFASSLLSAIGLGAMMKVVINSADTHLHIPILITIFVLALTNIVSYFLIYQVQKLLKNKYELKLLQEKMAFEKDSYEESAQVWENIRKVRHDIKNHFVVIRGHLQNQDLPACEDYIEKIMPSIESTGNLIQSNNTVLDYLINSKLSGLEETQIIISGVVGNFDDIEDTDLASVIGNVLDNAVEAQENVTGTKRIELLFRVKNENRVIICKNTVSESVLQNNKELRSTKKNRQDHGLGHKIVETILQKYDGWADYFENDDMFGVQIMLPMPRENHTPS